METKQIRTECRKKEGNLAQKTRNERNKIARNWSNQQKCVTLGTIHIYYVSTLRFLGPLPPTFLVLKIRGNGIFLPPPPTSDYVIYEWFLKHFHLFTFFDVPRMCKGQRKKIFFSSYHAKKNEINCLVSALRLDKP